MISKQKKFIVGLFVLIGLALALAAMIWLGAAKFFQKGYMLVSYFDQSVQGLQRDAPVKYRGVPVGRVVEINVAPDYRLVEVVMKVDPAYKLRQREIRPLVASLKSIGITGSMFIELDRQKKGAPDLSPEIEFKPPYPVIPSKPSDISQIIQNVDKALARINSIDFQGASQRVISTLEEVDRILKKAKPGKVAEDLQTVLSRLRTILQDPRIPSLIRHLDSTAASLDKALADMDQNMEKFSRILNGVEGLVVGNRAQVIEVIENIRSSAAAAKRVMLGAENLVQEGQLTADTFQTKLIPFLNNLEKASRDLEDLMNSLSSQPSQILFSRPPQPRKTREDSHEP